MYIRRYDQEARPLLSAVLRRRDAHDCFGDIWIARRSALAPSLCHQRDRKRRPLSRERFRVEAIAADGQSVTPLGEIQAASRSSEFSG